MSEFNFERDIAPERNTFGFTGTESAFANAKADQQIMPQLDLMIKLRGQLRQERAADFAYETSVFEFKQRKKTLRDEREADQRADELLDQIQMTVENDQLNPFERQEQLSLIQLQNADTFANSKVAQQSILAAGSYIGSQMQQRNEKLSRKLKRKDERRRAADTTGLDANTIFRMESDEQVEDLRQSYLDPNSAGGKNLTARERANLRNAGFAVTKNIEDREKLEKKEREDRETQIFRNSQNIAKLTLDEIEENLKAIDLEQRVGKEDADYSDFDGLDLPDGSVITGTDASDLKKQLRIIRSKTRKDLADASKRRNRFLSPDVGKNPKGTKTGTKTGTPTVTPPVTPTGDPDPADLIGG